MPWPVQRRWKNRRLSSMNASHLSSQTGRCPKVILRISLCDRSMIGGGIATGCLMGETCPQQSSSWPSSSGHDTQSSLPKTSAGGPSGPHSAMLKRLSSLPVEPSTLPVVSPVSSDRSSLTCTPVLRSPDSWADGGLPSPRRGGLVYKEGSPADRRGARLERYALSSRSAAKYAAAGLWCCSGMACSIKSSSSAWLVMPRVNG